MTDRTVPGGNVEVPDEPEPSAATAPVPVTRDARAPAALVRSATAPPAVDAATRCGRDAPPLLDLEEVGEVRSDGQAST